MNRQRGALAFIVLTVIIGAILVTRDGSDCDLRDRLSIEGAAELLATDEGLSVVLTSEEGFTMGALFWILRIGDTELQLSQYPDFSTDKIEFPIPDGALVRFQDGDGVGIRYGNPVLTPGSNGGDWAEAQPGVDRGEGIAHLRVAERCP